MDKDILKRITERIIIDNNIDERFCQLYESIINELNDKKYFINIAKKTSIYKTPLITISLKKKRNRPMVIIFVSDKKEIVLDFICRSFIDVPLNKINKLIDDCYYNKNNSKIAKSYTNL